MFAADYLADDDLQGARLRGAVVEATWDPELAAAMQARGLAVREEQVVEQLLADLASRASDSVPAVPNRQGPEPFDVARGTWPIAG